MTHHVMNKKKERTFLHDAVDIISLGNSSIERDDFSRCFQPIHRSDMYYSGVLCIPSFFIRYFILMPTRIFLVTTSLMIYFVFTIFARMLRSEIFINKAYFLLVKSITTILCCRISHKGTKKRLNTPHIYVANHTTLLDFLLLSSYKFPHACVAENHGGLFSYLFKLILGGSGSIAFRRSDKVGRSRVKSMVNEHVMAGKLPMIVFPEGTCVNNEYSVIWQKGVFELDVDICPVAIKYSRCLVDPYWNRRKHGFTMHMLYFMSRWYTEAEIHWLPVVRRSEKETAIEFCFRTKKLVSCAIKQKNTLWNGYMKSSPAIKDRELLKVCFIKIFSYIKRRNLYLLSKNDVKAKRTYLNDKTIDNTAYNKKTLFSYIKYKKFINEILREYLRLKELPINEQDQLIYNSTNRSQQLLTGQYISNEYICTCRDFLIGNDDSRFKVKLKHTCKIETGYNKDV